MAGYTIDPVTGEMIPAPAVPMPNPTPTPGSGTTINSTQQSPAPSGAYDNIYNSVNNALTGAHNWFTQPYRDQRANRVPVGQPIGNTAAPGSSGIVQGPGGTQVMNPGPPVAPNFMANAPMPPPRPQGLGQPAPQAMQPPAYSTQGAGWAGTPNMDNAALGDQIMGGGLFGGGGPPQGALAQQPSSPFTMVMRPNAPANSGGRGGGGTPLTTALDLSGWRQPVAPAPSSYNLGYGGGGGGGGGGRVPAPPAYRAQAPAPYNPFTHIWRDAPADRAPVGQPIRNTWAPGASGIVQGRGGAELLNPGKPLFGW